MPAVVKVPVLVKIPIDATAPCAEPKAPAGGVKMESQLGAGGVAWKITAKCNAAKLQAIQDGVQPPVQP